MTRNSSSASPISRSEHAPGADMSPRVLPMLRAAATTARAAVRTADPTACTRAPGGRRADRAPARAPGGRHPDGVQGFSLGRARPRLKPWTPKNTAGRNADQGRRADRGPAHPPARRVRCADRAPACAPARRVRCADQTPPAGILIKPGPRPHRTADDRDCNRDPAAQRASQPPAPAPRPDCARRRRRPSHQSVKAPSSD